MNIGITVAHGDDLGGASEAFVYEDLDRELDHAGLTEEAYSDMRVDYPGLVTEVHEVAEVHPKILVRVFA